MYRSVPLISTSIGAEGIDGAEKMMEICDTADEFASSVVDLYDDFDVLKNYAKKSLDYVKNRFSVDAAKDIIKKEIILKN
jgi:hypothetical protein